MRKVIVLTSIMLCLSIVSLCYFAVQYKTYYNTSNKKDIKRIEVKIKQIENKITKKREEIAKLKEENKEKVELLELWEKELKKIKRDF